MWQKADVEQIISNVEFRDWDYLITEEPGGRLILQIQFDAPDNFTGMIDRQYCRKWFLSPHMTKTEIVATAFAATKMAIEHECREEFRYKGEAPFNTHIDVEELVVAAPHADVRT